MPSGRKKNPEIVTCEGCGKGVMWLGGRKRRYCTYTCRDRARGHKPRKTSTPAQQRARRIQNNRTRGKQRKALSDALKIERGQCADCGLIITERTVIVIDWDHRDPTQKSFTIAKQKHNHTIDELINEMAKCDAVCANCHRYRTHDKQQHRSKPRLPDKQIGLFDEPQNQHPSIQSQ